MIFVLVGLTAVFQIIIIFGEIWKIWLFWDFFDETHKTTRTVHRELN